MESKRKSKLQMMLEDKKAVFGLTSVQAFFAIILGLALLAYVIVVIMGTLSSSAILSSNSATVLNESGWINSTGYQLAAANKTGLVGFANPVIIVIYNSSNTLTITSANYTISATGLIYNGTATFNTSGANISYSYNYQSNAQGQTGNILNNVSTGIAGFFSSISPVYSILAILVIILVLVVLVRVTTGSTGTGGNEYGNGGSVL